MIFIVRLGRGKQDVKLVVTVLQFPHYSDSITIPALSLIPERRTMKRRPTIIFSFSVALGLHTVQMSRVKILLAPKMKRKNLKISDQ